MKCRGLQTDITYVHNRSSRYVPRELLGKVGADKPSDGRPGLSTNPRVRGVTGFCRGLPIGGFPSPLGEAVQSLGLTNAPLEAFGREEEALGLKATASLFSLGDSGGIAAFQSTGQLEILSSWNASDIKGRLKGSTA